MKLVAFTYMEGQFNYFWVNEPGITCSISFAAGFLENADNDYQWYISSSFEEACDHLVSLTEWSEQNDDGIPDGDMVEFYEKMEEFFK